METLQEFMTATKGNCYIFAGAFLFSAIFLWRFLVGRDKADD